MYPKSAKGVFLAIQVVAALGLASASSAQSVERVVIDAGTADPVGVLVDALTRDNQVIDGAVVPIAIEFCRDLDLTGQSIVVGSDRSLLAGPACVRGPRQPGPLLFVNDARPRGRPLFVLRGDRNRFAGFRLKGPSNGIYRGAGRLEKGIMVWPFELPEPIDAIDIGNLEVFHWSGVGVEVRDNTQLQERGRLFNTNEDGVRIHDSFFHHNRHASGDGYGVAVVGGGFALIERNVFDENRHAIAGGSSDGKGDFSGYHARENLILRGGGVHCPDGWYWGIIAYPNWRCWRTHQIDMHGDRNAWYSSSNWCCGNAGETILIDRNTILYTAGAAIKIRGHPTDKAVVEKNVFREASQGSAIKQNDPGPRPVDIRADNVFGVDPFAGPPVFCDFAGDGQDDVFVATGVTWWAKSPTTGQWRWLNTQTGVPPRLQFGDLDGDLVCDVYASRSGSAGPPVFWSKSGTAPWKRFLSGPPPG